MLGPSRSHVYGLLICAFLIVGCCRMAPCDAEDAIRVQVSRAYAHKQYDIALPLCKQLLRQAPEAANADETWYHLAVCEVALEKWQDARADLTTLLEKYPASPYVAPAMVTLFDVNCQLKSVISADRCWNDIMARWPDSTFVRQMMADYLASLDVQFVPASDRKLAQILQTAWTKDTLVQGFYQPLTGMGEFERAQSLHEKFQQILHRPNKLDLTNPGLLKALASLDQSAYESSFTIETLDAIASAFEQAMAKRDEPLAKKWLTLLNQVAAEDPRAMLARLLYREQLAPDPEREDNRALAILPTDGFNLRLDALLDPHYAVVQLDPRVHNWFAGKFVSLPLDSEVTIGFSMVGNDAGGNKGNVSKWQGLRPVFTYGDPEQYATYEWFRKDDDGRWMSGDPLKTGVARYAGTGVVPEQSVINPFYAKAFLSPDGKYWSAWQEIEHTRVLPALNICRITQQFDQPVASVAMRVPFTYTYLQQFITRLKAANLPGVVVDTIGQTPQHRELQAIRLEDPTSTARTEDKRTVLVIARETGDEPAGSWALQGMIAKLVQDTPDIRAYRKDTSWIFIPIQDPDGSANSWFDHTTEWMCHAWDPKIPKEIYAYAHYIVDYINSGRSIDMSLTLHNIEANENVQVFCPFVDARFPQQANDFNASFFTALAQEGYITDDPAKKVGQGWMNFRLYGYCALHYGTFDLAYEFNDRYPEQRMPLDRLQHIGEVLATKLGEWQTGDEGRKWHEHIHEVLAQRAKDRAKHFTDMQITADQRNEVDYLVLGY